jgi:16S rRNA G966 N2-methylase RsmD
MWAPVPYRHSESIIRRKEARANRVQGSKGSQLRIVLIDPPFRMNQSTQVVLRNMKVDRVQYFNIADNAVYALLN